MKESRLYPSGWTHRRYFEPRTANRARTAAVPGAAGAAAVPGEGVTARVTDTMTAAAGVTAAVTSGATDGATAGVTAMAVSGEEVRSPAAATESQPGGFL